MDNIVDIGVKDSRPRCSAKLMGRETSFSWEDMASKNVIMSNEDKHSLRLRLKHSLYS